MANQLDLGLRAWDANGYIAPGAKATVYLTGTSTLINVFSDVNGSVAVANPIVADGDGYWPQRFVTQTAKVVITDADDATLLTLDPAPTSLGDGSAASDVSFSPTIDVPETNVQAAIEAVSASVVSGFAEFGVGITGNATLLANIDTQTTGAGDYRFDGTTLGTFPTGLVAADTGKVNIERQASNAMDMEIGATTGHRVWRRRLVAGTWGPWRDVVSVPTSALANGDIITRASGEWARLGIGSTGQVLRVSSGAAAWAAPGPTVRTRVATTSGTAFDEGSIPTGVTKIEVTFSLVSLDSTGHFFVQVGPTAGIVSTGYDSCSSAGASGVDTAAGFIVFGNSAARQLSGRMVLTLHDASTNTWVADHSFSSGGGATSGIVGGGRVALAGQLENLRLTCSAGNNFDGGSYAIRYE